MLTEFINKLSERESTTTVFNPYSDPKVANNLKLYLQYLLEKQEDYILLIGEAPGYAGCKITGIPFTSGVTIINSQLDIFKSLKNEIYLSSIESEKTATIVWEYLETKNKLPIFWNSFPFHPHDFEHELSNREPNKAEIEEGKFYIEKIIEIFNPKKIAAIGRKGEITLNNILPNQSIEYIRHPSRGGKKEFLAGIDAFL